MPSLSCPAALLRESSVARCVFLFVCAAGFVFAGAAPAQDVPKDKQPALLLAARQQYYNLRAAGVQSYTCDVAFDWNGFFTAVTGKPLPATDPTMVYLNGLKVQLKSDLSGQADVKFTESGAAPEDKGPGLAKLQESIQQMMEGFVQAWAPTLNGTIIPETPMVMRKTPEGYTLRDETADGSEETLDNTLRLTSLKVKTEAVASLLNTTFTSSPQGLLMTEMQGDYSQPASAPPTPIDMKAGFAPMGGYQLPSSLMVTVPNVASFKFAFSSCTVKKSGAEK